jgi:hypothetical protein
VLLTTEISSESDDNNIYCYCCGVSVGVCFHPTIPPVNAVCADCAELIDFFLTLTPEHRLALLARFHPGTLPPDMDKLVSWLFDFKNYYSQLELVICDLTLDNKSTTW